MIYRDLFQLKIIIILKVELIYKNHPKGVFKQIRNIDQNKMNQYQQQQLIVR